MASTKLLHIITFLTLLISCQHKSPPLKAEILKSEPIRTHKDNSYSIGAFPDTLVHSSNWPALKCKNFYQTETYCFTRIFDTIMLSNVENRPINCRVWFSSADGWSSCHRYWINAGEDSVYIHSSIDWKGFSRFFWLNDYLLVYYGLTGYYDTDPKYNNDCQESELFLLNTKTGEKNKIAFDYINHFPTAAWFDGFRNDKIYYLVKKPRKNYLKWIIDASLLTPHKIKEETKGELKVWLDEMTSSK